MRNSSELLVKDYKPASRSGLTTSSVDKTRANASHLVALAVRGLSAMFDQQQQLFCYKVKKSGSGVVQEGISHRYTMMTLLGLHRLKEAGQSLPFEVKTIFDALLADLTWLDNIGDLGIVLWLCAVTSPERLSSIEALVDVPNALVRYKDVGQRRTMELSWFLTGLSYCALSSRKKAAELKDVAFQTYELIKTNRGITFFGHQARSVGLTGRFRGRIGSFADQVYPIYAMTQFFRAYEEAEAAKIALDCASGICQAQGPLGQWWWHYDSAKGRVAEGYPVFSVHQHAMGPMTLFALTETLEEDFTPWIDKGLAWVNSHNELNVDMEDAARKLIWRCIFRSQLSATSNYLRSHLGRHQTSIEHKRKQDLKILFECRPYELGWLLYAFANRCI